ncbi:MAG: glycosyltransferase [bacterium]
MRETERSKLRKVLFIAYFFPPLGGGGVQRALEFVKHLPQHGWQPMVLTSDTQDYHAWDPCLLQQLPAQARVVRAHVRNLLPVYEWLYKLRLNRLAHFLRRHENGFLIPDRHVGWYGFARKRGLQMVAEEEIDLIFSTAPPYTAHLVASFLKRRTGLPWVADFRDEWSDYGFIQRPFGVRQLQRRWEARVLAQADRITTTTPWITGLLRNKLPQHSNKFSTVTNGFDQENFGQESPKSKSAKLVLTHAGSFYGHRVPDVFLQALAQLLQAGKIKAAEIEIQFVGSQPSQRLLKCLGIEHLVTYSDAFVSHKQALAKLRACTAPVLMQSNEGRRCIPGKVYEYLALHKRIVALVPRPSAVASLLQSMPGVYLAEFNNKQETTDIILKLFDDWKNANGPFIQIRETLGQFEYGALTGRLAQVFDMLTETRHNSSTPERGLRSCSNTLESEPWT